MLINALVVKDPPASAEDIGDAASIPGSGKSPLVGNGNPLQYSCLDRGAMGRKDSVRLKQLSTQAQPSKAEYHVIIWCFSVVP